LVTLEDILEEIVGEIQDEFDAEPPKMEATHEGYVVDGLVLLDEIADRLGLEAPEHESNTLGGFVIARLGRIARRRRRRAPRRLRRQSRRDERPAREQAAADARRRTRARAAIRLTDRARPAARPDDVVVCSRRSSSEGRPRDCRGTRDVSAETRRSGRPCPYDTRPARGGRPYGFDFRAIAA